MPERPVEPPVGGRRIVAGTIEDGVATVLLEDPVPGRHPPGIDPVTLRLARGGPGAFALEEADPGHAAESFSGMLAASPGGHLVAAWTRAERRDRGVFARVAAPGAPVEAPERIAAAGLALAAAVNDRGDALVAWAEEDGRIKARVRSASGELGPRRDVGHFEIEYFDSSAGFGEASAAIGPRGEAILCWTFDTVRGDEAGEPLFQDFYAAVAAPGRSFRRPRHLERSTYTEDTSVEALALGGGQAVVAWGGGGTKHAIVRGRRIGRRQVLARRGDDLAGATGPDGSATLIWLSGAAESSRSMRAVVMPGGDRFGSVQSIGAGPAAASARDPAVAFDPRTGRPVAVWVARGASGDVVRAATRR